MIGTIFLQIGGKFPKNGTTFVADFWLFTEIMEPVLFGIFILFSNSTFFVLFFSYFAQIGCTVFKATFCIGTFYPRWI